MNSASATVPGLSRPHKYLTAEPTRTEQGYRIEDGALVDDLPAKVRLRDELERLHLPSGVELKAEEASWAARSGPVYTIERK